MKRVWLRDLRRRAGLTQAELAGRIGKPQSFISKLELGTLSEPSFTDVIALAKALDVDPLSIRFGEREAIAS
jgi:transcriptional regulator with XRE-family HTH domain